MAESKEFADQLLDAMARRMSLKTSEEVSKEELKHIWDRLEDQNFDSRLQIFFDMYATSLIT